MLKKCPLFPDANVTTPGMRQIDCPNTICKFNNGNTCLLLQGAALSVENHGLLQKMMTFFKIAL